MRQSQYLDEQQIRKTIGALKPDNQLFEIRVMGGNKKDILSGYFTDADKLISAFDKIDVRNRNVYITLNYVKDECYARTQHDCFLASKTTTSDDNIQGYEWLFIDLDPVRLSDISSTREELGAAQKLAGKVYTYLKELGFNEPIKALSGNGCHLLYKISLKNTKENEELVANCLKALSEMFDNEKVKIDTVNYNPARICKLHGTLAQKGANTSERPHRMSRIFSVPNPIQVTDKVFIEKLAKQYSAPVATPAPPTYKSQPFDLERFMADNGLTYEQTDVGRDGSTIYRLDECPFNHDHRDGDAKIFHYADGRIAFKCHHNSCSSYRWQDVRQMFDPNCYQPKTFEEYDRKIDEGWRQHNRNKTEAEVPYGTKPVPSDIGEMFRTAKQIAADPEPEKEYVPTGINGIDMKLHGLAKTEVTVVTGLRGGGKSTLLGQIMLNSIENKHTVVCYSGELNNKKYLNWLVRQAAGHNNIQVSTKYENGYDVPADKKKIIYEWMDEYFWLYNNKYGNKFTEIAECLRMIITKRKADLCVIDNLMILNLSDLDGANKYEKQSEFVRRLKLIAESTNCHILFVAHPKKAFGFLRLEDISGSGDLANMVDNALIVHRVNHDFKKYSAEEFGWKEDCDHFDADNVIEIAKDRENGTQDYFVDLFFDANSKRLLNSKDENVVYSWDKSNGFMDVEDNLTIPF